MFEPASFGSVATWDPGGASGVGASFRVSVESWESFFGELSTPTLHIGDSAYLQATCGPFTQPRDGEIVFGIRAGRSLLVVSAPCATLESAIAFLGSCRGMSNVGHVEAEAAGADGGDPTATSTDEEYQFRGLVEDSQTLADTVDQARRVLVTYNPFVRVDPRIHTLCAAVDVLARRRAQ